MVLCRGSRCGTDNDPVRITFGVSDSGALTSFFVAALDAAATGSSACGPAVCSWMSECGDSGRVRGLI